MAADIATLASPHLLEALEDNMVAFWKAYGVPPGRRLDERSDRVCVMTGIPEPLFNAVFRARLVGDAVVTAIEEIRRGAAQWNVPLFWWLTPTTTPLDLGDTLLKHGFLLGKYSRIKAVIGESSIKIAALDRAVDVGSYSNSALATLALDQQAVDQRQ